jgi:hypothetical protein
MANLVPWLELQGHTVQTIAKSGRFRSVIEDVPEVSATTSAKDFTAFPPEAGICGGDNIGRDKWFPKTRPARAGFELRVAGEQRKIARRTAEDSGTMFFQQGTRASPLRSFLSQDGKLRGAESGFPFRVGFLELRRRRQVLCGRGHRSGRRFRLFFLSQSQQHRTKTRDRQECDPKVTFHHCTRLDTTERQSFTAILRDAPPQTNNRPPCATS